MRLGPGYGEDWGRPCPGPHGFLPLGPQEAATAGGREHCGQALPAGGPVRLGPRSVLQHCHLRVRPGAVGGRSGPGRPCSGRQARSGGRPLGVAPGLAEHADPVPLPAQRLFRWDWLLCEWPGRGPSPRHCTAWSCVTSSFEDTPRAAAWHPAGPAFTLVGRLDSWEVGAQRSPHPIFRP